MTVGYYSWLSYVSLFEKQFKHLQKACSNSVSLSVLFEMEVLEAVGDLQHH